MRSSAVEATKKECKREEIKASVQRDEEQLEDLKQHLEERGVDLEHLDLEGFFANRVSGIAPATKKSATRKRAGDETQRGTTSKVAKKESRKGKKEIAGREGFQRWTAEKKLEFIHAHSDENTSEYRNDTRQWLMRANPIAVCFRQRCEKRTDLFVSKHGNGKDNFAMSNGVRGCAKCCVKKK